MQTIIKLKPWQTEFVQSEAKFPGMFSAWGTGKDLSALTRSMIFSQETEDNLGLILRAEYKDLADSTIRDFETYTGIKVNSDANALIPSPVKGGKPSVIMFRHIEQLNNLQNINLGWFWINQAEELADDMAFQLLKGRLRRPAKRRSGWVTKNANGHDWAYKLWLEQFKNHPDYPCWQATTYDNSDVLPADYVASLKDLPENLFKRFVMNDHSVAEGLVWPEFNEDLHTCNSYEIPKNWKDTFALDHGHEHPTAVLFGAVDYDGTLIIYNEHYEAGQLISYHAKRIKEIEPDFQDMQRFIDPTTRFKTMQDGQRCYSILESYNDYGISFKPSPIEPMAAINKVAEMFKANKIMIFKDKCTNLIREIKGWKWKKPKAGQPVGKEEPLRIKEDACKALSYLVGGRFMAPEVPKAPAKGLTVTQYLEDIEYSRSLRQGVFND